MPSMTPAEFFAPMHTIADQFKTWVQQYALEDKITADHFGYKCVSSEEFETHRAIFEKDSAYIYQSVIAGRRIAIIKLKKPIETICGPLYYFELSDQKPDGSQKSGFDHLEFFPKERSVEEAVEYLKNKGVPVTKVERPHHVTYDMPLTDTYKIRIEREGLIQKIVREEMKLS